MRRLMSRLTWPLADQAVSSFTNYLLLVLLIRGSSLQTAGAYAFIYNAYFLIQAVARGLSTEPLTVKCSPTERRWHRHASGASAMAIATGIVSALLLLGIGAGAHHVGLGQASLALGIVLPFLIAQDAVRLLYFARGRFAAAFLNDCIFAVAQIGVYAAVAATGTLTPTVLFSGWGAGGAVAAVIGFVHQRILPRPSRIAAWWRHSRDISVGFVADYTANRGSEQLALVGILATAGGPGLGAVTAARTLFAPLTTVQSAVSAAVLPAAARLHRDGEIRHLIVLTRRTTVAMAAMMLLAGVALWSLPDNIGHWLFATNWAAARSLVVPMTAFSVVNAIGFALWTVAKAQGRSSAVFVCRLAAGVLLVVGATVGGLVSWTGAVLGMTAGATILVITLGSVVSSAWRKVDQAPAGNGRHAAKRPPLLRSDTRLKRASHAEGRP